MSHTPVDVAHENTPVAQTGETQQPSRPVQVRAFRFVLLIGVLSFFADFTYEGARSVLGPYLALLGASATAIGFVTGLGELAGYGLRLFSGRWADATGRLWFIAILGYVIQMASVPALAFADSWGMAATLIVLERVGKAIRNPPRDVMLSQAGGKIGGYGWAFGVHEAMDQFGAMVGPLVVAWVLAKQGSYQQAFAILALPAVLNICFVVIARLTYPRPEEMEPPSAPDETTHLPRLYWIYLGGALLVAAGFADYPLLAYHFGKADLLPGQWIALFYAVAMAVSGTGSLVFGRLFDRFGFHVLTALTALSALFAPLVFLGGFWSALIGTMIWGVAMGVHESMIPAAVSPMVSVRRRATAFGIFTAAYGVFWFLGSALIGFLYDLDLAWAITFCVVTQLLAVPVFMIVGRRYNRLRPSS
ncbi:putative membrane protein [Brucella sp. 10RB9215]|nr:putative membrane protein [Brucella sp. 10RB9215]